MNELVFLEPDDIKEEPFTTSKVIAEHGKIRHKNTVELIRTYENDLNEFGKVTFRTEPLPSGQSEIVYRLNEQQATFLITLMRNKEPVVKFKKALVKQFYIMQKELNSRRVTRQIAKQSREALTNAIQALPESPHKGMKYKHFTDLVYKMIFDKNAKQFRDEYGISDKDNLRDRFSAEENSLVEKLENQISVLLDLGHDYNYIKAELSKNHLEKAV